MRIIEIKALDNGAHRNQTFNDAVPYGWAIIPDGMECENFPFGEVEVTEVDGIMTITKWTPGTMPEPKTKTPSELREEAYNTEKLIDFNNQSLTVTEASQLWQYYAAEGSDKANELQVLISNAKSSIREKYPD